MTLHQVAVAKENYHCLDVLCFVGPNYDGSQTLQIFEQEELDQEELDYLRYESGAEEEYEEYEQLLPRNDHVTRCDLCCC